MCLFLLMFVNKTMKEDKMENIHLIFKFLWYSILYYFVYGEYLVQVPELIKRLKWIFICSIMIL